MITYIQLETRGPLHRIGFLYRWIQILNFHESCFQLFETTLVSGNLAPINTVRKTLLFLMSQLILGSFRVPRWWILINLLWGGVGY